jgi:hypothetical protein
VRRELAIVIPVLFVAVGATELLLTHSPFHFEMVVLEAAIQQILQVELIIACH